MKTKNGFNNSKENLKKVHFEGISMKTDLVMEDNHS
jgi:hypothetical protein